MINLEFIRHGTTDLNGKGYIATKRDLPLNENGIQNCIEARFEQGTFDKVYCSPFKRTIETAHLVYPYIEPIITDLISQRDLGVLNEHLKSEYDAEYLRQIRNYLINPENAESIEQILKRLNMFYNLVKEQNNDESNILVVSHNGIMRIIKKQFYRTNTYEETSNLKGFVLKLEKNR